jgi:hypothetical protein
VCERERESVREREREREREAADGIPKHSQRGVLARPAGPSSWEPLFGRPRTGLLRCLRGGLLTASVCERILLQTLANQKRPTGREKWRAREVGGSARSRW